MQESEDWKRKSLTIIFNSQNLGKTSILRETVKLFLPLRPPFCPTFIKFTSGRTSPITMENPRLS